MGILDYLVNWDCIRLIGTVKFAVNWSEIKLLTDPLAYATSWLFTQTWSQTQSPPVLWHIPYLMKLQVCSCFIVASESKLITALLD